MRFEDLPEKYYHNSGERQLHTVQYRFFLKHIRSYYLNGEERVNTRIEQHYFISGVC